MSKACRTLGNRRRITHYIRTKNRLNESRMRKYSVASPSARHKGCKCVGLFYPDLATNAVQGRHLDYYWDGTRVDVYLNPSNGNVFRIVPDPEA